MYSASPRLAGLSSASLSPSALTSQELVHLLCHGLPHVDQQHVVELLAQKTPGIVARALGYEIRHYDYLALAGRLAIYQLRRRVTPDIKRYVTESADKLQPALVSFLLLHQTRLAQELAVRDHQDYNHDWHSSQVLIADYLLCNGRGETVETPQLLCLRVAAHAHQPNLERVIQCYRELSDQWYTAATPTLNNSGLLRSQCSSCVLLSVEDSAQDITEKNRIVALLSKFRAGIGLDVDEIRAIGSPLSMGGRAAGLIAWLRMYDATIAACVRGEGRKGAMAVCCSMHHLELQSYLAASRKEGPPHTLVPHLSTALWIPWLFWRRFREEGSWLLVCPAYAPQLAYVYGLEWERRYLALEHYVTYKREYYQRLQQALAESNLRLLREWWSADTWYGERLRQTGLAYLGELREEKAKLAVLDAWADACWLTEHPTAPYQVPLALTKVVSALELGQDILLIIRESGKPYLLFGDAAQSKSNLRFLIREPTTATPDQPALPGIKIRSNLCTEIYQPVGAGWISSCNLASISVRTFVRSRPIWSPEEVAAGVVRGSYPWGEWTRQDQTSRTLREHYSFVQWGAAARAVVVNLNQVVERNWYPDVSPHHTIQVPNDLYRPLAIGPQGFHEALYELDLPYEDHRSRLFYRLMFFSLYWNVLASSVQEAIDRDAYHDFSRSPFGEGKFQFDLWAEEHHTKPHIGTRRQLSDYVPLDPSLWGQEPITLYAQGQQIDVIQPTWADLRRAEMKYGLANSLLTAVMPTAGTSQNLRNAENVEPHQSNLYCRNTLSGQYLVLNRHLNADLQALGAWSTSVADYLQAKEGSIQGLDTYLREHPESCPDFNGDWERLAFLVRKYKTAWEIKQAWRLQLAYDGGMCLDQGHALKCYYKDATLQMIRTFVETAEELGLKTGLYYLLNNPAAGTAKFNSSFEMAKVMGYEGQPAQDDSVTGHPLAVNKLSTSVCQEEVCSSCT
jgi:ribonucleotide reductase alpha subunit